MWSKCIDAYKTSKTIFNLDYDSKHIQHYAKEHCNPLQHDDDNILSNEHISTR